MRYASCAVSLEHGAFMRLTFAAVVCCGLGYSLVVPTLASAESFRQACKIRALCPDSQPGGGRAIACLRAHKAELSVPCKLAIADFFLNRQGHRGGGAGPAGDDDDQGGPGPRRRDARDRDAGDRGGPDGRGYGDAGPDGGPGGGGPDGPGGGGPGGPNGRDGGPDGPEGPGAKGPK